MSINKIIDNTIELRSMSLADAYVEYQKKIKEKSASYIQRLEYKIKESMIEGISHISDHIINDQSTQMYVASHFRSQGFIVFIDNNEENSIIRIEWTANTLSIGGLIW